MNSSENNFKGDFFLLPRVVSHAGRTAKDTIKDKYVESYFKFQKITFQNLTLNHALNPHFC